MKLSENQVISIGDTVRIELPNGEVTVGKVTSAGPRYGTGQLNYFDVGGRTYRPNALKVNIVDETYPSAEAAVRFLSEEEVRDFVADLERTRAIGTTAVSVNDIARAALGFDPTVGLPERNFGGKSSSTYWNQFIKLSTITKAIKHLTESGALVKVNAASRFSKERGDERFVHISGRTGWVTASAYEEGRAAHFAKVNEAELAKLREAARSTVADRHAAEVEEEFTRLRNEAGL